MPARAAWAHAAREYYWTHARLQRAYARAASARARLAARRARTYEALIHYCAAARRLHAREPGNARLRERGLRQLGKFVRRAHGGEFPATAGDNRLLAAFLASARAEAYRRQIRSWTPEQRLTLRENLLVLKAPRDRERGVLLLFFTGASEMFLTAFDAPRVLERFTVVLEPSWSTFPEPYWAYFAARETPALCQAITDEEADAIASSGLPLVSLPFGAQDWVDGDVFRPLGLAKEFDLVMVANFAKWKRHAVLFEAMRRWPGPRPKVALVGFAWERTQEQFEAEMRAYGVRQDCTLFRNVDAAGVNEILNRSRVALLLSRIEGGNRGLMEAIAAGTPVVVYRHIIGPRHSQINPQTGRFADDRELGAVLCEVLANPDQFQPRAWFDAHSGHRRTTERLNAALRAHAGRRGEPWTQDIACKVNRPGPQYANPDDAAALAPAWRELESMLVIA
ncbi:MAG: glycosyltransferase [Terriglobales bacterium]